MRSLLLAGLLVFGATACAAQAQDGDAAYRAGRYQEAISFFERRVQSGGADAMRALARVYLEIGRYADAEKLIAASPHAAELGVLLSDALRAQGKMSEARAAAERARNSTDSLNARLRLGLIAYDAGQAEEAYRIFDTFIDSYNSGRTLNAEELLAVGIAVRHLGDRDPQLFRDALKALDEAAAAAAGDHRAQVELGRLFLEKYNADDARKAFTAVLSVNPRHPDALLGLAQVLEFDHRSGAVDSVRKVLEVNPSHAEAHAFLAHAFLAVDMRDSAEAHAQAALASNPASLSALTAAAAVEQTKGNQRGVDDILARVHGPAAARVRVALAELSVSQRQYRRAVQLAQQAVHQDSLSWRGWSVLGINQLRSGDVQSARASLERAFRGDPYNPWVKNSLDLLDRLDKFETRTSGNFQVVASSRDVDVLTPYVVALGEEAFARLAQRYGYTPPTPIRLELYDRHADFSVRTVGLAGLGALGVSFGGVLAMDAPSARKPGEFNWGSTLWHELAHAFHLGMTEHRVPRWFTEGLAVLEERRARPGWGEEGLPVFAAAVREKKLLPIAELNNGFVRPSYPQQVQVSYYQASLILEMIEQAHGERAIREMLKAYAAGKNTEDVLREVLRTAPEVLDRQFAEYVRTRLASDAHAKAAREAMDYDALLAKGTVEALEMAMYISPYDINAHARLAELYQRAGNTAGVVRERQAIVALQPVDMAEARYQLALAHFQNRDRAAARREVLKALEIAPNFERAQELLLQLSEDP